jgi:hypothetical protein
MNLSAAVAVDCTAESRGVVARLKLAVQLTATEREALQQSLKSLPIQINYEEMA